MKLGRRGFLGLLATLPTVATAHKKSEEVVTEKDTLPLRKGIDLETTHSDCHYMLHNSTQACYVSSATIINPYKW